MDYEFGDILDARNAPIGHFMVVLGEKTKKGKTEVMYYLLTSRVYVVFKDVLVFFNYCIANYRKDFVRFFNKEKGKLF